MGNTNTLSVPNALQALVAVTINGCRGGCVHHNLMPVLLPPSSPLHLQTFLQSAEITLVS